MQTAISGQPGVELQVFSCSVQPVQRHCSQGEVAHARHVASKVAPEGLAPHDASELPPWDAPASLLPEVPPVEPPCESPACEPALPAIEPPPPELAVLPPEDAVLPPEPAVLAPEPAVLVVLPVEAWEGPAAPSSLEPQARSNAGRTARRRSLGENLICLGLTINLHLQSFGSQIRLR